MHPNNQIDAHKQNKTQNILDNTKASRIFSTKYPVEHLLNMWSQRLACHKCWEIENYLNVSEISVISEDILNCLKCTSFVCAHLFGSIFLWIKSKAAYFKVLRISDVFNQTKVGYRRVFISIWWKLIDLKVFERAQEYLLFNPINNQQKICSGSTDDVQLHIWLIEINEYQTCSDCHGWCIFYVIYAFSLDILFCLRRNLWILYRNEDTATMPICNWSHSSVLFVRR